MEKGKITLDIYPYWSIDTIKNANISLSLRNYEIELGENFLTFMEETYGIPSNVIWDSLKIFDEYGEVFYKMEVERIQHKVEKRILLQRETKGEVKVIYRAEFLPARPNPVMDMGYELNGIIGTGCAWLPKFAKGEYETEIYFHKDNIPSDCRLLCGYGEDTICKTIGENGLQEVFYCFGKVDAVEENNFGYYWMKREGFDAKEVAHWTKDLFLKMADFFEDEGETYKIFARARKCHVSGGVAGIRSYTYIYDPEHLPEFEALKFLFAHEMVHNWIQLNDKPYGTCTWYVEGMAEYYSLVLPWRFGLVTREEVKHQLESRIKQYYENPCRLLSNQQLGNLLFQDLEATDVPYGRGMFYFMQVDKRIRENTNGTKNLDCVTKRMQQKVKENETLQNLAWIKAVEEETGMDELEYLLLLSQGELILPEFSCFEEAEFQIKEVESLTRRSGEKCTSYIVQ